MKNEGTDLLVKEKMTSLDTLSGGIVYGKEQAWEKLQGRMEQKQTKTIQLKYWLAAAAVLLLMVCAAPLYFHSVPGAATTNGKAKLPENKYEASKTQASGDVEASIKIAIKSGVVTKNKHRNNTGKKEIKTQRLVMPDMPLQHVVVIENKLNSDQDMVPMQKKSLDKPVSQPMKTVHINELENGVSEENAASGIVINTSPAIDISKMKAQHINKVMQQENDIQEILRQNKTGLVHTLFSRQLYHDHNSNTEDYFQPHNFIKTILDTQN